MVILLSVLTTITPHSFLVPTIISKLPIHCPSSLFTLILYPWWPITTYFPILLLYSLLFNTMLHSFPSAHHHCLFLSLFTHQDHFQLFFLVLTPICLSTSHLYRPLTSCLLTLWKYSPPQYPITVPFAAHSLASFLTLHSFDHSHLSVLLLSTLFPLLLWL